MRLDADQDQVARANTRGIGFGMHRRHLDVAESQRSDQDAAAAQRRELRAAGEEMDVSTALHEAAAEERANGARAEHGDLHRAYSVGTAIPCR